MTFEKITHINIPSRIIQGTLSFLQKNGLYNKESHCLWIGKNKDEVFIIKEVIFPKQLNNFSSFRVSADELDKINRELYKKKLKLIAQVHSHPRAAYHSHIDDKFPLVTTLGSFSIVIPYFGYVSENNIKEYVIYRLKPFGWVKLSRAEKESIFKILE